MQDKTKEAAPLTGGPVDRSVRPVVSMTIGETRAILSNPYGLRLLMDHEDFQYCQAESMFGPGEIESWPTKRWTELRERGRLIIAEDPELWGDDIKREFGFETPNVELTGRRREPNSAAVGRSVLSVGLGTGSHAA